MTYQMPLDVPNANPSATNESKYDHLEHLGKEIKARIQSGEKHEVKAEEMYKSAGLFLIEARDIIKQRKGVSWLDWLRDNCSLGNARAYELISLAEGKTTLKRLREEKAASSARTYNAYKASAQSSTSSGKTSEKTQQYQHWSEFPDVKEVRTEAGQLRALQFDVVELVRTLNYEQLKEVETFINKRFRN